MKPQPIFDPQFPVAQAYLQVLREACEADFRVFVRYFFKVMKGTKFIFNEHHDVMCEDLMRVHRGEVQNLIMNMPPRYSKTLLGTIMFTAWSFAKNPRCEFIHLSYAEKLVLENSDAIRELMRSAEYQQLWPHITIRPNKDAKEAWETAQGGKFFAAPAGGMITGFGAGRMDEYKGGRFNFSGGLILDDALKPDDARHDRIRQGINRRWTETIQSRRNSPRTPTILTMQRIHVDDFTATLCEDKEFTAPEGDPSRFLHRKLKALIDEGLPTERSLWPAKHSVETLKSMRDKRNSRGDLNPLAGETFSGQYQQEPTPAGGGIMREEWWRFYASRAQAEALCTFFFITADTAYTSNTANDPSSIQLWGAQGSKRLYLLDRISGHWEFPELVQKMTDFWAACPKAKRLYIENKASGPSLGQTLKRNRKEQSAKVVLWKPSDYSMPEDKVGRMKEASLQVHAGLVWLPSPDIAPWVDEFVDQHSEFTADDTHLHDDDCDAQTMAVSVWTKMGGGITSAHTIGGQPAG